MKKLKTYTYTSISNAMDQLGLPKPKHPLIALVDYKDINISEQPNTAFILKFYKISFKKHFAGAIKYGQGHYDFEEGGLSFTAPDQIVYSSDQEADYSGYTLIFHPEFLRNYPLAKNIANYGFFSYSVAEALYLSDKEKQIIFSIFENIILEVDNNIDHFSQDVIISQIELLLNYSNRFYNRQFITRKPIHNDMLSEVEAFLSSYFDTDKSLIGGLPTVQDVADHVKVSPRYLSDMLRLLTGQTTQQHIHSRLIEKAKSILANSDLSVAEIAYQLGFEHPQSFNKLFKQKTKNSPVEFRKSLN
ncbi:AraC family transcriptional regulator [Flavobacterium sp. MDT1-60]|uniref:helix-turn-helix domain-containing protein n=1 Tax=Flavobacterium sp. MDT1-60 TaxID=1979344 RepID=UPI001783C9FD|nr:helix-turn-helix transcriptional regulator [Flavobacterium sp. MDT1-60]QOG01581.1 helix-turn-helix transcriptional regulator [Flavobacterium sp. MDT1-60]